MLSSIEFSETFLFLEDNTASAAAAANFGGLVLGCIDASDSEITGHFQHF